jgi:hypothetical protein
MWSTSRVSQRTIGDKWAYRDLIAVGSTGWPGTLAVLEEARTGHKSWRGSNESYNKAQKFKEELVFLFGQLHGRRQSDAGLSLG